jgi:membrane AbrB-like protein
VLLACMLSGLVFALRGLQLAVPKRFFGWGQGLLGCLIARSLHPDQFGPLAAHWPAFLGITLVLIAASSALGWAMMRRQVMPGTTAIWGMAPGGASAMVAMAEEFGADVRLVAFMQYTRVVIVTVVAAVVARAAGAHITASTASVHWLELGSPSGLLLTALLVLGGGWVARRFAIAGGAILIPLVAGLVAQFVWGLSPALPPALLVLAYAAIGWSVGLRFARDVLLHALRALPKVLAAIALLIGVGVACGGLLMVTIGLDPLSAYLATSPGGVDAIAVIATTSAVETSFVMAMQLTRFMVVLIVGPALSRWLAQLH